MSGCMESRSAISLNEILSTVELSRHYPGFILRGCCSVVVKVGNSKIRGAGKQLLLLIIEEVKD